MTQHPHVCGTCAGILRFLQEAADAGLRFTPEERRALMARCEKSIAENTEILAARGYTQDASGRWGYHGRIQ